jgi:TRAP-type C4-dicarboxylate transport system permease small subunit
MIKKILDAIRKMTNFIVVFLFTVVVVVVFAQVIARYVGGSSIRWADEVARFAFVWLVYLGGTTTIRDGRNVCFDLLLESRKGRSWKAMFTLVSIISVLFLIAMTYLGTLVSQTMIGESSPILQWPMAVVTAAVPVGGVLMFFEQISYYIEHINDKEREKEA